MVTDTEIFGSNIEFPHFSAEAALKALYESGTVLWEKVLRDQFVHKEMAPFYASLLLAKKTLEWYNDNCEA